LIHHRQLQQLSETQNFCNEKEKKFLISFVIFMVLLINPGICASQNDQTTPGQMPEVYVPSEPESNAQDAAVSSESESNAQNTTVTPYQSGSNAEGVVSEAPVIYESYSPIDRIPDILIPSDPEGGTEYVIVVEKETQQLFLYENKGTIKKVLQLNCSTGKARGDKIRSGDQKTPEGVYFFIKEHKKKELAPIYGSGAFPMDYPSLLDRMAEKTGNAIWLHGTNKPLKDRDSNGCVALENSNFDMVADYITLNRTPIVIVDKLSYSPSDVRIEERESILSLVSGWENALGKGTYHDYLKFYDPEYLPDISWWPEWNKKRKTIQTSQPPLSVESKKVLIIKHKAVYVVLFDQFIKFSGTDFPAGTRKLFLTRREDRFRIIGEEYQGKPRFEKRYKNQFVAAYQNLEIRREYEKDENIAGMVDNWLKAWSSKDIEKYGSYYAGDFRSQGMNLKSWLDHKKRLNKKYDYIHVSKDKLRVKKGGKRCTVSFVQIYKSNAFKAVGMKQLVLKREGGQWKIYRETWRKM